MKIVVDLHSHSGHAGGVGNISLADVASTMSRKGIDVFGTSDCLQLAWLETLTKDLAPAEPGLFSLPGHANTSARFLLQTEIILTAPVAAGGRKTVHTILLFPTVQSARSAHKQLDRWGVKLGMGRPFLCCEHAEDVAEKLTTIADIDPLIEIIPAHVLTPQGIYGADNPVEGLSEFYGEFSQSICIVETGLSADPRVLALIPELDTRALISNSDCHSAALNRIGREFTALEVDHLSYQEIIQAMRNRNIIYTAEFTPSEGRYFLTGHRAGVKGHDNDQYCYYSPDCTPDDNLCPICGKRLTTGVLERALQLSSIQGDPRTLDDRPPTQRAIHMVPLIEVIAAGLGIKSVSSKKARSIFDTILGATRTEANLWEMPPEEMKKTFADTIPKPILLALLDVAQNNFTFEPLGYDGSYGKLVLGEEGSWFGHCVTKH